MGGVLTWMIEHQCLSWLGSLVLLSLLAAGTLIRICLAIYKWILLGAILATISTILVLFIPICVFGFFEAAPHFD